MRMKTVLAPCLLLLASSLATSGCVITSSGLDEGSQSGTDEERSPLEPCSGDADEADATLIVDDYDQSIHEMVACGGLSVALCGAITTGIVDAIINNRADATPDDWEYRGEGTYYTNSAMAEMTTHFYLAQDMSFGREGDALQENLFLVSTYLQGARVELEVDTNNPLASRTLLHFDAAGPYIELLGYGAEPQSPIEIDTSAWGRIEDGLGALLFDSDIQVDDTQSVSTVRYHVTTTRMPATSLINGGAMGYELQMADASRADTSQNLMVDNWGVEFTDGASSGALSGRIDFSVDGGDFEYEGSLVYDDSSFGTPEYRCPQ